MSLVLKHILTAALLLGISTPAFAAKKKSSKRIVKISLADSKIKNQSTQRKPNSVNGKVTTYVPNTKTPKKVLLVDRNSEITEGALDPIKVTTRKPAQNKTAKTSRLNAEIDPETIDQTVAVAPVAPKTSGEKSNLRQLRKQAEKAMQEDYF